MSDRMGDSVLTHVDGRPYGMPRKAYVRMLDTRRWKDWIEERGGEESAMVFICAQVSNGVPLPKICEHYVLDFGLLWGLVSSKPEWLERYYLAQRGVAEYYVGEVVGIADDADPEAVNHAKLQIDTRMKVAGKWHRDRYGDSDSVLGSGLENLATVLQRISERKQRGLQAPEPEVIDADVLKEVVHEEIQGKEAAEEVLGIQPATAPAEQLYI